MSEFGCRLPQGRCGLKYRWYLRQGQQDRSPSARKVWIEIAFSRRTAGSVTVAFRKEGVDWNTTYSLREKTAEGRLPQGRCGLKYYFRYIVINFFCRLPQGRCGLKYYIISVISWQEVSPSARKVWIEILLSVMKMKLTRVAFRKEGVDWNIPFDLPLLTLCVAFRKEGVDWNLISLIAAFPV